MKPVVFFFFSPSLPSNFPSCTRLQRSHTQGLKGRKAPIVHTPEYRHTHPRGFVLGSQNPLRSKFPSLPITPKGSRRSNVPKQHLCVTCSNPKLPDTVYSPGRDTKLRPLLGQELHAFLQNTARCHTIQTDRELNKTETPSPRSSSYSAKPCH